MGWKKKLENMNTTGIVVAADSAVAAHAAHSAVAADADKAVETEPVALPTPAIWVKVRTSMFNRHGHA